MLRAVLAAFAALVLAAPAWAQVSKQDVGSKLETGEIVTKLVPSPAKYTVLFPPGYDKSKPLPLLLMLHGGGGDNGFLDRMKTIIDAAWAAGDLPPVVVVTPDVHRSLYMDYKDGSQKWETFIVSELVPELRRRYNLASGPKNTLVTGVSMGGLGSLRLGFDHPEMFGGLAAMEPGIEPALRFEDVKMRNRFQRDDKFFATIFGEPVDKAFWQKANPANMVIANRDKIVNSGLKIYIEVGTLDMFHLDEGTEYLHRVMWDHNIPHEYRLVLNGDHTGATINPRMRAALRFLTTQVLQPPGPDAVRDANKATIDSLRRRMGVPDDEPRPPFPSTDLPK